MPRYRHRNERSGALEVGDVVLADGYERDEPVLYRRQRRDGLPGRAWVPGFADGPVRCRNLRAGGCPSIAETMAQNKRPARRLYSPGSKHDVVARCLPDGRTRLASTGKVMIFYRYTASLSQRARAEHSQRACRLPRRCAP